MRYLLYSFYGDVFFAKELEDDPGYFCDLWSTNPLVELDPCHFVVDSTENNDFDFMYWFTSYLSIEKMQQEYPEYFI